MGFGILRPAVRGIWRTISPRQRAYLLYARSIAEYFEPLPDADFHLVSFPKCGSTWLRTMLGRSFECHFGLEDAPLLRPEELARLDPRIPKIRISHDDGIEWKKPREISKSKRKYRNARVLLLVRDPRDVVVSWYFHQLHRKKTFAGSMSEFLSEKRGSFDTILEFYKIWGDNLHVPLECLLVSYEELTENTFETLSSIMRFLKLEKIPNEVLYESIEFSSFDNMRKMEERNALNSPWLRAVDAGNIDTYKVRKGRVGDYVNHFSPAELEEMERCIMKCWQYSLNPITSKYLDAAR